jgi:hypothetical protein
MRLSRFVTGAFTAIALTTGSTAAHAQSFQEWTTCAPFETNGFVSEARTCFTTRLETDPILTAGTRTGTSVSLLLRNLQGTAAGASYGDTAPWSGLMDIWLFGPAQGIYDVTHYGLFGQAVGGATGTMTNDRIAALGTDNAGTHLIIADNDYPRTTVGGCNQRPGWPLNYGPMMFTCAATAWVDFSYSSTAVFDATNFDGIMAQVVRTYGGSDTSEQCATPTTGFFAGVSCHLDVVDHQSQAQPDITATPEPGTLGLFATALVLVPFGVGRARRSRGRDV